MAAFTSNGTENRMRWDRRSRGFAEAWYATLLDARAGVSAWLRYTITAPQDGEPFCELWGTLFEPERGATFAARRRLPIDHLGAGIGRDDGALVRIGDAWLSENHLEGAVDDGRDGLAWSLDLEVADATYQHVPGALRGYAERLTSVLCSPNLDVAFSGTLKLGDRVIEIDAARGCQSHRWGRRHPASWAWAHCGSFQERDDVVLEALAARPAGGLPTLTSLYLGYGDERLVFNQDLRAVLRAKSRYEMPTWAFTAVNERYRVVGAARANIGRLIQCRYDEPDGSVCHCVNSGVADLAVELYRLRDGVPVHETSLTSLRGAQLEFGRREPFPELPVTL